MLELSVFVRYNAQEVIDTFSLPENHIPVMMLALGYPAHLHDKRKPIEETVKYL